MMLNKNQVTRKFEMVRVEKIILWSRIYIPIVNTKRDKVIGPIKIYIIFFAIHG